MADFSLSSKQSTLAAQPESLSAPITGFLPPALYTFIQNQVQKKLAEEYLILKNRLIRSALNELPEYPGSKVVRRALEYELVENDNLLRAKAKLSATAKAYVLEQLGFTEKTAPPEVLQALEQSAEKQLAIEPMWKRDP